MDSGDESDSSSEPDSPRTSKFHFWNNWVPPKPAKKRKKHTTDEQSTSREPTDTRKVGNWLLPDNLVLKRFNPGQTLHETLSPNKNIRSSVVSVPEVPAFKGFSLNEDWGTVCQNLSAIEDGEVWDLINPGLFGVLKLSINPQGNITTYANAEYSKFDGTEKVIIVINDEIHLRKLLEIEHHEWVAFTDMLKMHNSNVHYDAMMNCDWQKLPPLQQMWYLICKRRHLLPSVCVRLKRAGVHKMTQFLQILPKFLVLDIRTCTGEAIS